jgi:hypothetical protein
MGGLEGGRGEVSERGREVLARATSVARGTDQGQIII